VVVKSRDEIFFVWPLLLLFGNSFFSLVNDNDDSSGCMYLRDKVDCDTKHSMDCNDSNRPISNSMLLLHILIKSQFGVDLFLNFLNPHAIPPFELMHNAKKYCGYNSVFGAARLFLYIGTA
jgi:hypothetical protein